MKMKKIVGMVLCISLILGAFLSGCVEPQPESQPETQSRTITIGALLPLTGDLSSLGESSNAALAVGLEEANTYFAEIGANTEVELIIEDTETDTEVALAKLKKLDEAGVKVVIGPVSSTVLSGIKDYADENGIVLISLSTAPGLAIADDNVLRLVPDDSGQAGAITALMQRDGIKAIVSIVRDDVWGNELYGAARKQMEGVKELEKVTYNTASGTFSEPLNVVNAKAEEAIGNYGEGAVGVYLVSFEEGIPLLKEAAGYEALGNVKWYGNDVLANEQKIVEDAVIADFAIKTGLINPVFGSEEETPTFEYVEGRITEMIGRKPDAYAIAAYDAFWLATNAYMDNPNDASIKKVLVITAEYYYGATGWTILNEAGDRKYGDYDLWTINEDREWEIAARYQIDPGVGGRLLVGEEMNRGY